MKLSAKLKPGMTVWSVGTQRMGNTTMSRKACWPVYIREVDLERGCVVASWNGNAPRTFYAHNVKQWRWTRPGTTKPTPPEE